MADVPLPIQLLRDDGKPGCLLQVQARWRNQVSRGEEICHFCTNVEIYSTQDLVEIPICGVELVFATRKAESLTIKEVCLSFLNIDDYLGTDLVQSLLQSFLNDHPVQRAGEQDLLVLGRVRIINAAFFGDQSVQFAEHEASNNQVERIFAKKNWTHSSILNFSLAGSMWTRTNF